jgi:hypothetical protein
MVIKDVGKNVSSLRKNNHSERFNDFHNINLVWVFGFMQAFYTAPAISNIKSPCTCSKIGQNQLEINHFALLAKLMTNSVLDKGLKSVQTVRKCAET